VMGDGPVPLATEEHSCPVCGITLLPSDFEESDEDYYCPYCSTWQKPSRVHHRTAREVSTFAGEEPSPALSGLSHREGRPDG
jgi:rubredoxin